MSKRTATSSTTKTIRITTFSTLIKATSRQQQNQQRRQSTRKCLCGRDENNRHMKRTMKSFMCKKQNQQQQPRHYHIHTSNSIQNKVLRMQHPSSPSNTQFLTFFTLISILLLHPNSTSATIQIHLPKHASHSSSPSSSSSTSTPDTTKNKKYESQPALFGELFLPNMEYRAHVQLLTDDVYLCGHTADYNENDSGSGGGRRSKKKENKVTMHYYSETTDVILDDDDTTIPPPQKEENDDDDDDDALNNNHHQEKIDQNTPPTPTTTNTQQQQQKIIMPKDNIPVALLAKRGKCSFEEKAQTAMSLEPPPDISANFTSIDHNQWDRVVEYVIVYDDVDHTSLVPMSASDSSGIFVGLLFVSYATGLELKKTIQSQSPTSFAAGGPYITIDSKAPYFPPHLQYDNSEEWTLITLAGLFIFLACSGCLLISVQSGFIIREGNLIVIGRRAGPTPPGFGNIGGGGNGRGVRMPRLLTKDQVLSLPEIEYRVVENGGDNSNSTAMSSKRQKKKKKHRRQNDTEGTAAEAAAIAAQTPFINSSSFSSTSSITNYQSISTTSNHNIWDTSCSICLDEYTPREMVRVLPCSHVFHTSCIVPWLTQRYPNCPLCKAEVVVANNSSSSSMEGDMEQGRAGVTDDIDLDDRSTSSSSSSEWVVDSEDEREGLFDRSSSMPISNTLNAEDGDGHIPRRNRIATWSSWMQRSRNSSDR